MSDVLDIKLIFSTTINAKLINTLLSKYENHSEAIHHTGKPLESPYEICKILF